MARRYDSSTTTFSPEGRLHQVEYAIEAINNAGTCVGILAKDGIIMASERRITSGLLAPAKVGYIVAGVSKPQRQQYNGLYHGYTRYSLGFTGMASSLSHTQLSSLYADLGEDVQALRPRGMQCRWIDS